MRFILYTFLLFLFSSDLFSKTNVDSLLSVWNNQKNNDSVRLSAMYEISWSYLFSNPDSAYSYAKQQYEFAKKSKIKKAQSQSYNVMGLSFFVKGKNDSAVFYLKKGLEIDKNIGDKQGIAAAHNNLAIVFKKKGDYPQAIQYLSNSLKLQEEVGDKRGAAGTLSNLGSIFNLQDQYKEAIDYTTRCLKIMIDLKDDQGMASAYNNLGNFHIQRNELEKAKTYIEKGLVLVQKIGDENGTSVALNNLGKIYLKQGKHQQALEYFNKSLSMREKIGEKDGIGTSFYSIGCVYKALGDSCYNKGNVTLAKRYYSLAEKYSKKSLAIAQELQHSNAIDESAFSLYEIYKKNKDHRSALEMFELYITIRDSLNSDKNSKALIQQQYKYEYDKKAAADSLVFAKEKKIKEVEIARQHAEIKVKKNQQYALFGGLALVIVFAGFMYNRFKVTQKQKQIIEVQKQEVEQQKEYAVEQQNIAEHQKHLVEEKNKEILDSITYAKRLQEAILPPKKLVKEYLKESFILYKPKDIVAGDFYWMEISGDLVLFAAADCTGHGVPGALVSVVCSNALNRTVKEFGISDPGKILDKVRELVIETFEKSESEVKDGMDISLCSLNLKTKELKWSGANNPLWIIRNESQVIEEIKADKQPIGKYSEAKPFTSYSMELKQGDSIYIFTDGYQDQFGGGKGKKFKTSKLKELFLSLQLEKMDVQGTIISETFEHWKGNLEQVDDVCIIGVKI